MQYTYMKQQGRRDEMKTPLTCGLTGELRGDVGIGG